MENQKPQFTPEQMAAKMQEYENQQRMKAIIKEKNEQVSKMNDERLATEIFANAKISDRWKKISSECIMKTAPVHHALLMHQFVMCLKVDPEKQDVSLFQFGVLNNALENVSPEVMGLSREEYVDLMENEVFPLMEIWKARVTSIREEIVLQVEAEFKLKTAEKFGFHGKMAKA